MSGSDGAVGPAVPALPPLHVVARDEELTRPGFRCVARELFEACGPSLALHLRAPLAAAAVLFELAGELAAEARLRGGWCVVNGRLDVALAAGTQGVQLGRGSLPVAEARRLAPRELAVGASVHSLGEARSARRAGANYLLVGTIFPTASHPERAAAGPALVRECAAVGPCVAIGGIDADRVGAVVAVGAGGVAVVRAVWESSDPVAAALDLRAALGEGEGANAGTDE